MISEIWSEKITTAMSSRSKSSLPYVKKHKLKECFVRLEKLTSDKLLVQAEKYTTGTCPLRSERLKYCVWLERETYEKLVVQAEKYTTGTCPLRSENLPFDTYKEKYNLKKCFVRVANLKFNPNKDDTYFSNLSKSVDSYNEKMPGSMRENSKNCAGNVKKVDCTERVLVPSEYFADLLSERCNVCLSTFQTKQSLWLHLQQEHKEEVPFMCRLCLKVFSNNESLISHGLQPCKCCMCGKTMSKFAYESHLKHCRVYNPYCCKICMERFFNSDALHDHMKEHTESNFLSCEISGKYPLTSPEMHMHLKNCNEVSTGITELQPINTAALSFELLPISSSKDSAKSNEENLCDINHIDSNADKYSNLSKSVDSDNEKMPGSMRENSGNCAGNVKKVDCTERVLVPSEYFADLLSERCNVCLSTFQTKQSLWLHLQQEHKEEVPFMCRLCLKVFSNNESLISHGLQPCKCCMCGKTMSKFAYESHLKHCRVYNPYCCKICMERFFNSDALHDHMKEHTESNFLSCEISGKYLLTSPDMHMHLKNCNEVSTGITELQPINTAALSIELLPISSSKDSAKSNEENLCDINHIDSNADKYSNLSKSVDSDNEKMPGSMRENSGNCARNVEKVDCTERVLVPSEYFADLLSERCNVCLSTFQTKQSLWLHLQQEHKEEVPFMCRLCLKVFSNNESLISHGLQPCKCCMCGKTMSKFAYESHLKHCRVYNPYRCKICMERFFNSDALHDHMNKHTESNFLSCEISGKYPLTSPEMHMHLKNCNEVSTGITELQPINTAALSFELLPISSSKDSAKSNEENLCDINHIDSNADKYLGYQNESLISSLEEKGRCSVCLCTFKDKRSLWLHVQDHAEETPFRCISCLKAFSNNDSLISHRIQSCKCAMCGNIVAALKFENHLNICEVYNTYCCRICEKRFSSYSFYSHMNSHKNSNSLLSMNRGEFQSSSSQISKNNEMHYPDTNNISELDYLCEKESLNIDYVKDKISAGETEVFTHSKITKSSYSEDTFVEGEVDNPIHFVIPVLKEEQDLDNEGDIADPCADT